MTKYVMVVETDKKHAVDHLIDVCKIQNVTFMVEVDPPEEVIRPKKIGQYYDDFTAAELMLHIIWTRSPSYYEIEQLWKNTKFSVNTIKGSLAKTDNHWEYRGGRYYIKHWSDGVAMTASQKVKASTEINI